MSTPTMAAHGHSHGPGSETSGLSAMLREIYGGSKLREFVHMFAMEPLPDMIIGTDAGKVTTTPDGVHEQTFVGPAMTMLNGNVVNKWLPIDWPRGHIAVKAFAAEVVKSGPRGEIPPPTPCCGVDSHVASRQEVFMHHWTVNKWQLPASLFKTIVAAGGVDFHLTLHKAVGLLEMLAGAGLNSGANGPCYDSSLHLYFGIGNEVRTKTKEGGFPYYFPDPYGIEFDSDMMRKKGEFMVLNTHLIDIRGARDKRACTECKCSELGSHGFSPLVEGGLTCCHSTYYDGGKCKLKPSTIIQNQTYYIRYTLQWRDFNPATTLPLEVISFDATDNNTKWGDLPFLPGGFKESHSAMKEDATTMARVNDIRSGDFDGRRACHLEWFVPPCETGSSCMMTLKNSWEMPYPVDIVFLRNHFHAGGVNMTTYTDGFSCSGHATYDDHQNVVDISACNGTNSNGYHLARGQKLYVESVYKQDDLPHYGVMSMSFVYAHIPRQNYLQV
jgi:hypothetical protein